MNIVISHVYSNDNKGDAALLSVLLDDIRRDFDSPQITILTMDAVEEGELFDGVPIKNSFMYYASSRYKNPLIKAGYDLFLAISTIGWAYIYRYSNRSLPLPRHLLDIVSIYRDADLIIPVGGGYIRSGAGFRNTVVLFFILHPLFFGYVIEKPTVGYTQSIGPFGNAFQENMAKFVVKKMDGVIVREKISLALLKKWGVTKNVFLSTDSAFSFIGDDAKDLRSKLGVSPQKMLVGITVRNWLDGNEQLCYERVMAELCDHIIEKYDAAIVFIPQVTVASHNDDDRQSSKRVYHLMRYKKHASVMTERHDHRAIKAIYGQLDYLLGTRFHSVIFALTSHVAAIAIGYEHKTFGIMSDLGLENWVVDIRGIDASRVINLFDRLVANRDSYIEHLKQVLPGYIEQSERSIHFVKETYQKNGNFF